MIYVCNRRRFPTFALASEHANGIYQKRGIIVAIETKPSRRHGPPFSKRDPGFSRRAERQSKARDRAASFT